MSVICKMSEESLRLFSTIYSSFSLRPESLHNRPRSRAELVPYGPQGAIAVPSAIAVLVMASDIMTASV